MKSKQTKTIEEELYRITNHKRIYGCAEVTIGFYYEGKADELVDFMTMDSHGIFRCYEIKVSLSDLHSKAKKSFYGHYNYLVVSKELYEKVSNWKTELPKNVGLMVARPVKRFKSNFKKTEGVSFTTVIKSRKSSLTTEEEDRLKKSLIRTLYWKMEKFKKTSNVEKFAQLEATNRQLLETYKNKNAELQQVNRKLNGLVRWLVHEKHLSYEEIDNFLEEENF